MTDADLVCVGCGASVVGEPSTVIAPTGNILCQRCHPIPPELLMVAIPPTTDGLIRADEACEILPSIVSPKEK